MIAAIEECGAQLAVPTTMLHIAGLSPDAVAAQAVPTAAAVKIGLVQNPSDSRSADVATTATATTAATAAAASPETVMRQSVDAYMEEMMAREATMGSDPYVMKDDSVDFNIRVPAEPAPSAEDVASSAENRDLSTHNMFNSVAADVTGEMYGDDEEDDDDDLSESYGGDAESASPSVIDHRKSRERQAAGQPTASEEGAEPKTFSAKDAEQLYYAPGVWGNTLRRSGIMPDAHKIVSNQAVARDRIRGAVTDIRATEYPDSNLSPDDLDVLLDEEQDEESESSALRPHESSFVGTEEKRDKSELATAFWEDRDIRERSRRRDSASSSSGSSLPRPEQQQLDTAIESHPQLPEREQLHGEVEELASVELDGLAENGAIIVKKICDVTDEDDFIDNKPSKRESSMVASDAEQQRIMGEMKQDDNDSNDESRNPDDEDDLFSGDHINSTL